MDYTKTCLSLLDNASIIIKNYDILYGVIRVFQSLLDNNFIQNINLKPPVLYIYIMEL